MKKLTVKLSLLATFLTVLLVCTQGVERSSKTVQCRSQQKQSNSSKRSTAPTNSKKLQETAVPKTGKNNSPVKSGSTSKNWNVKPNLKGGQPSQKTKPSSSKNIDYLKSPRQNSYEDDYTYGRKIQGVEVQDDGMVIVSSDPDPQYDPPTPGTTTPATIIIEDGNQDPPKNDEVIVVDGAEIPVDVGQGGSDIEIIEIDSDDDESDDDDSDDEREEDETIIIVSNDDGDITTPPSMDVTSTNPSDIYWTSSPSSIDSTSFSSTIELTTPQTMDSQPQDDSESTTSSQLVFTSTTLSPFYTTDNSVQVTDWPILTTTMSWVTSGPNFHDLTTTPSSTYTDVTIPSPKNSSCHCTIIINNHFYFNNNNDDGYNRNNNMGRQPFNPYSARRRSNNTITNNYYYGDSAGRGRSGRGRNPRKRAGRRIGNKNRRKANGAGSRRRLLTRNLQNRNMGRASGIGFLPVYRVRRRRGRRPAVQKKRGSKRRTYRTINPRIAKVRRKKTLTWKPVPNWKAQRMKRLKPKLKIGKLESRKIVSPRRKLGTRKQAARKRKIAKRMKFDNNVIRQNKEVGNTYGIKPLNLGLGHKLQVKPSGSQKQKLKGKKKAKKVKA